MWTCLTEYLFMQPFFCCTPWYVLLQPLVWEREDDIGDDILMICDWETRIWERDDIGDEHWNYKWHKETRILSFHYKLEYFISFKDNESRKQQTQQQSCDTTKQERPSCFRDTTNQERHSYFRDTTNQQRHKTDTRKQQNTSAFPLQCSTMWWTQHLRLIKFIWEQRHKNNKQKQKPEMCSPFGNRTRNYSEPPDTKQK